MLPPQVRRPLRARRRHPNHGPRRPFSRPPELQAPHRRGLGSLYAALDRGRIDDEAPRKLLARYPLASAEGEPSVYAVLTRARRIAATPRRVPSAATTTIRPATPPASPSSPGEPTSSLHNWASPARAGPPPWT